MKESKNALIKESPRGLYCERGDFYLDPLGKDKVGTALISHAHADHLRWGHKKYICSEKSKYVVLKRLTEEDESKLVETHPYGKPFMLGDVLVSFHPAGHILGSAQIRMECDGEVWVYTGDFKRGADPTCEAFEPVECDYLISEATFSYPIFKWPEFKIEIDKIYDWWMDAKKENKTALLGSYSLGKAQRIIAALREKTNDEIFIHGAVDEVCKAYAKTGLNLENLTRVVAEEKQDYLGALVIAPPAATRSTWSKKFKNKSTGFASGWMRVRGHRRRRGVDRGFIISDHADWKDLLKTFEQSRAKHIYLFHQSTNAMIAHLRQKGFSISTTKDLGRVE